MRRRLSYATSDTFDTIPFHTYTFRGNGLFDPDVTSAGAQPYAFDQYMALYKNFRVIGSKIKVNFLADTSAAATAQCVCVVRADSASGATLTTWNPAICARNSAWKTTNGFATPASVISMQRTTRSVLDLSEDSPSLVGTASADPTVQWHWHVHVGSLDGSSAATCNVVMMVEYDVEFSGLKTLELS